MIENPIYYFITIILLFNVVFLIFHKDIANFLQLYDEVDNKRKIHRERVAITGGIYIFINFAIISLSKIIFESIFGFELPNDNFNVNPIFIFSTLIFFIGLYDDKYIMSANTKFFLSIIIVGLFISTQPTYLISFLKFNFLDLEFNVHQYRYFFTLLCFMLFINACNMFDGINGQSSSYFIFILVYLQIITGIDFFLLAMVISIAIYLYLNITNKSFLGDGGIFLLSFLIAGIIIKKFQSDQLYADQIFLIMLIPGLDMLRLFIQRITNKKNPFLADNKHIHHLLLKKFSKRYAVIVTQLLIIVPNFLALIFSAYMLAIILSSIIYLFLFITLSTYSRKN
jgi:UDP-GlcNAc:undecaprenyl-phosphate GlcNAc-1-phosphate transferase